jgi:hypothetical protein
MQRPGTGRLPDLVGQSTHFRHTFDPEALSPVPDGCAGAVRFDDVAAEVEVEGERVCTGAREQQKKDVNCGRG